MRLNNRAVITGIGVVSPIGIGKKPFWDSLLAGKSGIGPITLFDSSKLKSRVAAEVKNFNPLDHLDPALKPKRMARHTQFAVTATKLALEDAGLDIGAIHTDNELPVLLGLSTSDFASIAENALATTNKGPGMASPILVSATGPHSATTSIAAFLQCPTRCVTICNACASGMDAIAAGVELIKKGSHDIVVAGGADCPIVMVPFANLDNAGMASRWDGNPEDAGRPFSKDRDSGVIGEGAGVLIIENLEAALARGATIYAEISGYGLITDSDPTQPCTGWRESMQLALNNSGLLPKDIDYVCAWGPGHPIIDRVETEMIKAVFKKHAYNVPITSIKGAVGNPLAAAAPLMISACALAIQQGIMPQTIHCEVPDPECDLDYIPGKPRYKQAHKALLNAHGIGGGNSSLIMQRVELP